MQPHTRRLLLVAFHFPPLQGSSGMQRAIAYGRYLPECGWDVTLLTVHPRAYTDVATANRELVPDSLRVLRAQAWDAARHFAVRGHYPGWLARPDRWSSWIPFAIRLAMSEFRRRPFDAVLSTFPIASAHRIGQAIHGRCRIPWLAEFRDPMATRSYPFDGRMRRIWTTIQDTAVTRAARIIVTTPGAARFYREMYPQTAHGKCVVIPNGFEPELLPSGLLTLPGGRANGPLLLLHSGMLYPRERDPEPFFRALSGLRQRGLAGPDQLQVRLRASGFDDRYAAMISHYKLDDIVTLAPGIPHADALAEMASANALLVFQARVCNDQIPAKAYEYLAAGRPIIALADPEGDTGQLLRQFGMSAIAALEDERRIAAMLETEIPRIRNGTYPLPCRDKVLGLTRQAGVRELARHLDQLVPERSGARTTAEPRA